MSVFNIYATYDSLILEKSFREGINGVYGLDQPIALKVSPSQRLIYVISRNAFVSRAITEFELNDDDVQFYGAVIHNVPICYGELSYPCNIKISQDSRFIYIAEQSNSICQFYKPSFILDLGDDIDLCDGDTVTLQTDETYSSYRWSNQSTDTEIVVSSSDTISLEVVDKYGRTGSDTIIITFFDKPYVDLGVDTTITINDTLVLTVDEGYETYLWNTGSSSNSISFCTESVIQDTIFSVMVINEHGCSAVDSIIVSTINLTFISNFKETDLIIYPNPFNNRITIAGNNLSNYNFIELIDLSGKRVYFKNKPLLSTNEVIRISDIKEGVYFLRIYNENDCIVKKLIKMHNL